MRMQNMHPGWQNSSHIFRDLFCCASHQFACRHLNSYRINATVDLPNGRKGNKATFLIRLVCCLDLTKILETECLHLWSVPDAVLEELWLLLQVNHNGKGSEV